jgi:hypothetical protein
VRGAVSLAGGLAAGSSAATAPPDARETFETLDSENSLGQPGWTHTGRQQAEAGFEDPSLGWVGVRAESGGGRVHAEVVPASTDAAQALSGHLAGLNAYLAEHHSQVETLTVSAPESRLAGSTADAGAGQQMQQGSGQQAGQHAADGAGTGSSANLANSSTTSAAADTGAPAFHGEPGGGAEIEGNSGVHISVMA